MNTKLETLSQVVVPVAISATFLSSLFFWQIEVNAANSAKLDHKGSAISAAYERKELEKETMQLKQSLVNERKEMIAEKAAVEKKFKALEERIEDYLAGQSGTYGFYLLATPKIGDKQVDKTIGYNENESFKLASTFKLPINLYLYTQIAQKKLSLDEKLVYYSKYYETGTGSLQYKKPGGSYTIRELASRSIRESDNVAINMLLARLGRENVIAYMKGLGASGTSPDSPHYGSPKDLVIYMKAAADFANDNPKLGMLLIEDLKNTIFNNRIRAGTPMNVEVAHKIGNLGGVVNDVGIVYAPTPYIIAVMSKNVEEGTASRIEAEVSKMVWNSIGG